MRITNCSDEGLKEFDKANPQLPKKNGCIASRSVMASSSSSTSARGRRRDAFLRQPSMEDDYEGPVRHCHHRLVAPRWTAWTDGNPGRRFYGCPYYNQENWCGYFSWHDGEFGGRANNVIKELLDDIDRLYDENTMLRRGDHGQRFSEEINAIYGELKILKHRHEVNDAEAKKWEMKFKTLKTVMLFTWVIFIVTLWKMY